MRFTTLIALNFGLLLCVGMAPPVEPQVQIVIEKIEKGKNKVTFHISVKNTGTVAIFLEEARKGSRKPHVVNLEKWQEEKWLHIGPLRDSLAVGLFRLPPGEEVQRQIPVTDPYINPFEKPQREISLVGTFRATVRVFLSHEEWKTFFGNATQKPTLAKSSAFEMPPKPE